MKKRKIAEGTAAGLQHSAAMESTLFANLHNVVKHLAVNRYDDGTPRTTGKVMIGVLGTAYVVTFKEPDSKAQLPVIGATLDDAFAMGDLLLGSDDAPWEIDPWAMSRSPKKGK